MTPHRKNLLWIAILIFALASQPSAHAFLGGFEFDDGYVASGDGVTTPNPAGAAAGHRWAVEYYNSGMFGANASGGSYSIGLDTGRWTSPIGGADDNRGYATKHKFTSVAAFDWLGDDTGHMLGVNGAGAGTGVTEYEYTFDSFDLGGSSPATLENGDFTFQIYICPGAADNGVNATTDTPYGWLSFLDGGGNVLGQFGTGQTWFTGQSGFPDAATAVWTKTASDADLALQSTVGGALWANTHGWSKWRITFHMRTSGPDTVSAWLTPAGQDAGSGVTQTFNPEIQILNHVPVVGGVTADHIAKMRVTVKPGGNKYFYDQASTTFAPAICPTITVTPSPLSSGTVGTAYTGSPSASGGIAPYAWTATGLPAGLSLNASTGAITGTPTASGAATITATDANGCTGTTSLTINPFACPTITVTPASLPGGTVGTAYNQTPTASGAPGGSSYTWTSTGLPAGLTLNASTGNVSGTPTTAGTATITATYTGPGGELCQGSTTLEVQAFCCPQILVHVP